MRDWEQSEGKRNTEDTMCTQSKTEYEIKVDRIAELRKAKKAAAAREDDAREAIARLRRKMEDATGETYQALHLQAVAEQDKLHAAWQEHRDLVAQLDKVCSTW